MIRVGTCSWTEKSLIQSGEYYPGTARSAEERLRFYSCEFDTVEVDSSYYALPGLNAALLWEQRTPPGFIFHLKVYGGMTGHGVDPRTLPQDLRGELSSADRERGRVRIREDAVLRAVAEAFTSALRPLRDKGKLGLLVYQYPPWFQFRTGHMDLILRDKELVKGHEMAVEFRHGSWLASARRKEVISFLTGHGITYITADEPQYGSLATVPFYPEVTTDTAYFRFHGRNRENWLRKGMETSLRYAYEYSGEELKQLVTAAREVDRKAAKTYAMFNNCHGASAVRNARRMKEMVAPPSPGEPAVTKPTL